MSFVSSRKGRHLTYTERLKIESLHKEGISPARIAAQIGCHVATIYRELKRGRCELIDSELRPYISYSPTIAQNLYNANATAKGAPLKIGGDHELAAYIEKRIIKDRFSPDAVLGEIRVKGLQFKTSICTKTLYSYIDKGIFLNLTNKNLLFKSRRKQGYKKVHKVPKRAQGVSIERRSEEVNKREPFGHWEMDTVYGPRKGKGPVLLVLTERLTRMEIIMKIKAKQQEYVVEAVNKLERKYKKNFSRIFQTITLDNGGEFLNFNGIEQSVLYPNKKRTNVFYCHPYNSCERGSNENANRLIRRFIPKGDEIGKYSNSEILNIQNWMNEYPRKILGYHNAQELFSRLAG